MRPLIAGNWKMHGTSPRLCEIEAIAAAVHTTPPAADTLICPPSTLIARAAQAAAGRIAIGGQDCDIAICGAFTGDVSAQMVKDAGAAGVIVGHSERRQHRGETDALVAAKAEAARLGGLLTIICIGETESRRRVGRTLSVCATQIAGSVPDGFIAGGYAIGYEPLWAIGSCNRPTALQVAEVHAHIRHCVEACFGLPGKRIGILNGASVNPTNAHNFLSVPEVGGALIGAASLIAEDFNAIIGALPAPAVQIDAAAAVA